MRIVLTALVPSSLKFSLSFSSLLLQHMETHDGPGLAPAPHLVLVPLPVQGHINPFISLANFLAASGVSVTLVRSSRSHSLLSAALGSSVQSQNVEMERIHIEVVPDGMPADPKEPLQVANLRESLNIIRTGVEELLMQEEQPPCCLIVDNLIGWGREVAVKFGLPWLMLWTGSASGFSMGFYIPELVNRGYIPAIGEEAKDRIVDFIPGMSPFRIRDLPKVINVEEDPMKDPRFLIFRSLYESAKHADGVIVNSIYELESSVVEALRKEAGFKIDPVGPLFMMSALSGASKLQSASLLQEDNSCLSWLDEQQESSVLYISFGSVASVEHDALRELAHGLEASGLNFLWVIRPDVLSDKTSVQELFPEGFMERTSVRGRIISWAPQLAVLGHPAVGAFLTHCGWNSVLESLCNGVPMLGFPLQAEQNTNLKFIIHDWKVGLPLLPPNAQQVERSHAQCTMTAIMRGNEATELRKSALQWKEVALNAARGSSKSNLEKLVDDLKCGRLKAHDAAQSQAFERKL